MLQTWKMFRQVIARNIRTQVRSQRYFAATAYRGSVIDTAKDLLNKANKKTGEVLADGIDKTEKVVPNAETVKNAADKVNKKTGEVLAEGIEKTEKVVRNADTVKNAAGKVNKKTGEVLADGIEKTEKVVPNSGQVKDAADKVNKKTGQVLADGIDAAENVAESGSTSQKERIRKNHAGYQNLQDKGSKAETEQNRPDDAL